MHGTAKAAFECDVVLLNLKNIVPALLGNSHKEFIRSFGGDRFLWRKRLLERMSFYLFIIFFLKNARA